MANTATLWWSLWVDCPKCGKENDLSDADDEHWLSTRIFTNRWPEVKGHECTCAECGHEFILDGGVEY